MHRNRMKRFAPVLLAAAALAGCESWPSMGGGDQVIIIPPAPTPSPQQLCEVTALAEERKSAIETVEGVDVSGWQKGETFLAEKLMSYEARMEIAYRGMVSSCNLYANCLDRNDGIEQQCLRSEASYNDARGQFYDMVGRADLLAAEIEAARLKAIAAAAAAERERMKREAARKKKRGHGKAHHDGECKPVCDTTQNIFTDNCCPVDDENDK